MKLLIKATVTFLCIIIFSDVYSQSIKSGPMLGYNTMREIGVWIQLENQGYAAIRYWPKADKSDMKMSETFYVESYKANTATIAVGPLDPGTEYEYAVIVNDQESDKTYEFETQSLWQWREDPPDFSFIAGSCVYINEEKFDRPGKAYGGNYSIFEKIVEENADFMVWLGDNTYLRDADWNSRTGIYHRYTHSRNVKEMQPLLSKIHHYAIWDDHDYGPNNSDGTYWGKDITREAFIDFWANPNYGVSGLDGITGTFTWNDCQFYMLDNRWDRTPQSSEGKILGDKQITWLIDALRTSKASFNFICVGGQVVNDVAEYENHAVFGAERKKLLHLIDDYNIPNVVFLNGDRHHSEVSRYETPDGQVIWDITSSSLTSGAYDHSDEPNSFRYKESMIGENNYAVISISGKRKDRKLSVEFKDAKGKKIKKYMLKD
jgi:alkaline phosphatase D